jgi:hypothetical protein
VDAATLLREARWVVETRKMALLESHGDLRRYQQVFRLAHAERLPAASAFASVNWQRLPLYRPSEAALTALLDRTPAARQLDRQGQVHLLLAFYPLAPLDQAYKVVYNKVLDETISTRPVAEGSPSLPATPGPRPWSLPAAGGAGPLARHSHELAPFAPRAFSSVDLRERSQALALRHARNDPPAGEVYAATSLNTLLADLEKLHRQGVALRPVPLAPEVLVRINLTSEPNGPTGGLLRDGGHLRWPLVWHEAPLRAPSRELRQSTEALLSEAIAQARKGHVDAHLLTKLHRDMEALDDLLTRSIHRVTPSAYIKAHRYLNQLTAAFEVLGQEDAARYVNGALALDPKRIKTVPDLVALMAEKGLAFAAAVRGDESAYLRLQQALASCDTNSQTVMATEEAL